MYPFAAEIGAAAAEAGLDPALVAAVVATESGFDPKAVSPAGALGLTQLMPATAAGLGVADPFDPAQNLRAGCGYLAEQLRSSATSTSRSPPTAPGPATSRATGASRRSTRPAATS